MYNVIQWKNRFSGEQGYVESLAIKNGHFINTFDINKAHKYAQKNTLERDLKKLIEMGEAVNNEFTVVTI